MTASVAPASPFRVLLDRIEEAATRKDPTAVAAGVRALSELLDQSTRGAQDPVELLSAHADPHARVAVTFWSQFIASAHVTRRARHGSPFVATYRALAFGQ